MVGEPAEELLMPVRRTILLLAAVAWSPAAIAQSPAAEAANAPEVLPRPVPPYQGTLGRTLEASSPAQYAPLPKAPKGAPNILLILTDDVGFGASSTFGGPVPTATFDRLAANGERYNAFHTTALCAPTRAALLTGRNPHKVGFGTITEMGTGYPGYNTILPKSAATIGEVLRQNGYATAWFGKNHNTPEWEQSAVGPFDRWPDGLGFDYFYGFMGGATSQYNPALFENRTPVERPANDTGYILDRDLADHAVGWLKTVNAAQPDKPVLLYYAPGTSHSPHHAPRDWIARFKGKFDKGWDKMREESLARQIRLGVVPKGTKLTPRPASIPAWTSLSADQKRLYAHMMEVYAAALAHADHQMGRLLEELKAQGRLENTLVIYIQGDNGGSGEGGPAGSINDVASINGFRADLPTMLKAMDRLGGPDFYNNYPVGWAWAMNTPFQWTKQVASHLGGVRNGMVISWPGHMKAPGGVRPQFHHIVDIAPTLYQAAGITPPSHVNGVDQIPLDGVSMLYSLTAPDAPSHRTHQLFELQGNAALYADGWWANSKPTRAPWDFAGPGGLPTEGQWELYDIAKDFSQSTDLAARHPERLKTMQDHFWKEAAKGQVLPIDNRSFARWNTANRPSLLGDRTRFSFSPSSRRITGGAFPDLSGRSWQVTARIEIARVDVDGTIVMNGSNSAGWTLALDAGRPVFAYKASDAPDDLTRIAGTASLAPGRHDLRVLFETDTPRGPGLARLMVDGQSVGEAVIPHVVPVLLPDNATVGWSFDRIDATTPSTPFSGKVGEVTVELLGKKR
jgi:arylsulfatase A-like enzyme